MCMISRGASFTEKRSMRYFSVLLCLFVSAFDSFAQQEAYDIVSYTPPKEWKKETSDTYIAFTHIDQAKKTWCQLGIYKSAVSKGSMEADFTSEWQDLVARNHQIISGPQQDPVQESGGWKSVVAAAKYSKDGTELFVIIRVFSGYNTCLSIVAKSNDASYLPAIEQFSAGIALKKPAANADQPAVNADQPAVATAPGQSIIGSWGKSSSVHFNYSQPLPYGTIGYTKDQYHFYKDGTYRFYSMTFSSAISQLVLIRESGRYTLSGASITVIPSQSSIESWSKKNGVDKWGKLLKTEKRKLEKVTYRFTHHYFSGIKEWNLVLQADAETERDGRFSTNRTFNNAWYFKPISSTNTAIELPGAQK